MDRAEKAARQWREERPDIEVGPMVLLGRLQEAALVISRDRLNPLFAEYGLQPGEFDVLATLRRSGAPYMLTPTALYNTAMISSGSMTNRIERLEKAGLVSRNAHPTDGRGSLVALTENGLTLIEEMIGAHVENQKNILRTLSKAEQAQLSALLEKLLADQCPPVD
ncbi:MAG: MarR family transcriptional regulator [Oxalicibacterium faecigallinarum]|uniref:MarR family winged helix-turn-helix transcriptional regulator n=1 Tax=Oxalicibacterium faecigallinarum TaxID=573741 RepID=UPI002807C3A9|nr:MarR family transcriptional regulator [Oxalicibacterium faecigallinarum]MDQ7968240.1 MarR family transcriptional regulator [Oxalicibacterium faecigallinarum]